MTRNPSVALTALVCLVLTASIALVHQVRADAAVSPCGATVNAVACENSQTTGVTPASVWDTGNAGDDSIQGFATDISVNAGSPISFKIKTTLGYTIDIYRLGYYGGNGARLWQGNLAHVAPVAQPNCLTDPATLLYDCGNWSVSATWNVPSNAVSGVFIAKLTATNGDDSQITFVVRNDASTSDILYQTSDPTWEAYNTYGGSDFYVGTTSLTGSQARAFKISYNRPFATRSANSGRDFLFSNEYPTIRYLERNGYDVSYISGVDTDRYGATLLPKHKVFLSVGHDEYWSQAQRTNVEKARDAGVNLMFLSGNEVYWHTRYEASIDSSHTAYRTLVSYKETWDAAKIDPTPEWTGTWRDPRFADAPGGANPENALTGTAYMANTDDLPITVTAAQGRTRLWRSTGLSTMSGASTALAPHTIGYESDEDLDNGFRPSGLVDLSTTVGATPQYLQDFGLTVAPGTTTHHLTLYRAASGALVFGAGTIQWGWALDQYHDGDNTNPPDVRIQQATANMLADMQSLPTTLMAGLTMPAPSTDTAPPTVTITGPTATAFANGTSVTVTGTAADVGGGQVAGVEVSVDAGKTWHPATGTTSWSYTAPIQGDGAMTIEARATDDSVNTSAPVTKAVTVACPCSFFGNSQPATPDSGDSSAVELGVRFSSTEDGYVSGIRFYKASANTGTHTGTLWSASGQVLASGTFTGESASGWQTLQFSSPVAVSAGTTYTASYFAPNGHYSAASNFFYYRDLTATPLVAARTAPGATTVNGVYAAGHAMPTATYSGTNYFVDVTFTASTATAPTVTAQTPAPGATSVSAAVTPTVTFSKAMTSSSLTFTLTDPNGSAVPGSVGYDAAARTATFTPASALAAGTLYTATVNGSDTNGNALSAPATWNFRTAYAGQVGGSCPCTIFTDSTVPATPTVNDSSAVDLGVKFTADTDGVVSGVRFYKGPQNIGTHTGALWTSTGTQLATTVFTNESTTGWQTATFSQPVAVTAGTTYIASYHTSAGYYSATSGAYTSSGYDNFPLHVPVNGGVYTYGGGFPGSSSTADYGVDVVFTVPANVVPSVVASSPADGDTGVGVDSTLAFTFSTSVLSGTTSVSLAPSGGGAAVPGSIALDSVHQTLTFTPSAALAVGARYTVTVTGARSLSGTAQSSPATWSFTTGGAGAANCPCTLFASTARPSTVDSGDTAAIELGVRVLPSMSGYLTGVRFYKAAANTGTHVGSVWTSSGTRLAGVTFTNETASGWQQATFSQSVPVSAGTTYVVSYYDPNGHYSANGHYFDNDVTNGVLTAPGGTNGVYAYGSSAFPSSSYAATNYWVDAVFSSTPAADTVPPSVTSTAPLDGASSVGTSVTPSVTFSEGVTPGSVAMTLRDAAGNTVPGTTAYDAPSTTATFTPGTPLARGTTYTVSATATDLAGNAMTRPTTWSFTTARPTTAGCPCSVWDDSSTPSAVSEPESSSVELGVAFRADIAGQVTGVRFYKGPSNSGTHTATLWSAAGGQLATGTYRGESTTGWQTLTFATPVAITANTTYVVSYHAPNGGFAANVGQFASAGVDHAPLHVQVHGGSYVYGASAYPAHTSDTNYWVDPVFSTTTADTTPPAITATNATAAGTTLTVTWSTDEPGTSRVDYGTSPSALSSSATAVGLATSHSVPITGISPNTRYYYRVTSADAAGNSATSPFAPNAPATFTPSAGAPLTDTTTADFATGTVSKAYVAANGAGEVVASPAAVAEFNGTALPSGWTSTNGTGGSSTVANGSATVLNAALSTTATYGSGRSLETQATLGANQSIGWVTTSNAALTMQFSVNAAKQLVATVDTGDGTDRTGVAASGWTVAPHRFRIGWTSTTATFYVDDAQVYTHAFATSLTNLRPQFRDTGTTDGALGVDWVRIAPYAASGAFISRVLDAGAPVTWDALTWDATVPAGTGLTVRVRSGNTATPGSGWTSWSTVTASGGSAGGVARYAQYQLVLTTGGSRFVSPAVRSVSLAFHAT